MTESICLAKLLFHMAYLLISRRYVFALSLQRRSRSSTTNLFSHFISFHKTSNTRLILAHITPATSQRFIPVLHSLTTLRHYSHEIVMTSYPPGKCCFAAVKHEGEAKGTMSKVGGYDAYVATPEDNSKEYGVVLFPDFMGYKLINSKLLADQFAANGYFTVIPDIWLGDDVPLSWEAGDNFPLGQWMSKHGVPTVLPVAEAAIKSMRKEHGVKKLGGVGYCLGAKYVCRFLAQGKGLDAGYFAHPTAVTADEVKGVAGPLSIAAPENDDLFPPAKRHETEEILKAMDIPYQITLYSDTEHGFAIKADLSNPRVKFATETAFLQAVNWFDGYLKDRKS